MVSDWPSASHTLNGITWTGRGATEVAGDSPHLQGTCYVLPRSAWSGPAGALPNGLYCPGCPDSATPRNPARSSSSRGRLSPRHLRRLGQRSRSVYFPDLDRNRVELYCDMVGNGFEAMRTLGPRRDHLDLDVIAKALGLTIPPSLLLRVDEVVQ